MKDEEFIDTESGISIEEQQKILTQINSIAENNKQRLSQGAAQRAQNEVKPAVKSAKKRTIFPIAVNAAAVIVLVAGSLFLISFNSKADIQARTGNAVYNLTEKALIEEIRRETSEKIAEKDIEISSIFSRLGEVDAQLLILLSGNQELTSEQLALRENLMLLQSSYRNDLSLLQEERSLILEDARSREERLKSVLDERTKELASRKEYSGELLLAFNELERLTNEQERTASIDAFLQAVIDYYGASSTDGIQNTSAVQNSSGIADNSASGNEEELLLLNAQLEEKIVQMQKTIDSFSLGGSAQERRIAELDDAVLSLRRENASLTQEKTARDRTILSLQGENEDLTTANAGLTSTNANISSQLSNVRAVNLTLEQRVSELEGQLAAIRALAN